MDILKEYMDMGAEARLMGAPILEVVSMYLEPEERKAWEQGWLNEDAFLRGEEGGEDE
jgi:hypothetical protein